MKNKKINIILIMLGILLFGTLRLQADSLYNEEYIKDPGDIIDEYIQSLGNNWEKVSALFIDEKCDTYLDMFKNGAIEKHIGMFNIINAKLVEKKEVAYKDVKENLLLDDKEKSIRAFVVGADYEVYENTEFYSQGIAYVIIAFEEIENMWKIATVSFIENPEELKEKGYKFADNYERCIRSMKNRKKGLLTDGDGKVFDRVFENVEGKLIENDGEVDIIESNKDMNNMEIEKGSSVQRAHTSYSVPTSKTMISYAEKVNGEYKIKYRTNFNDFCLGCTACEVGSSGFDGVARQANVIAIKTFVWHYYIIPMDPNGGYNLNTEQIAYKPYQDLTEVNINGISRDVLAVSQIWMESASGKIFAAYFKKGTYDGNGRNGGELKQNGSRYLANRGYSRLEILHYYYDNSTASQAGPVQFFYASGKPCYK